MKKICKMLIAVILATVIAISVPLNAFAASTSVKYLSDIKISYGKTLDDAKKWLINQGYEVVDSNLNEKADSMLVSARAVCLGYKTTNNAEEAITDLKVMNMKGNYSFDEYEMVIEKQAEEIGVFVSQLTASLEEYRENYKNGLYKAVAAHDLLDKILDNDTNKTMGELLLNKTIQELSDGEYEAMTDEERLNHADMVKILMQGNSSATLSIEQYLCIASDTESDSFVDRLAELNCYDDFETDYARSNNITDGTKLEKSLAAAYDDTAIILADKIADFAEYLDVYTNSEMFGETDEEAITDYFDKNGKDGDYLLFCNARNLYLVLTEIEYEDGTLYDFLTSEDYDFTGEDRYMLYPFASVLSDGQRACAQYVSLSQLFDNGIMDNDAWKLNYDKIKTDIIDKSPVVSAYAGINREVFNGGVALTNKAKQLNESSDDNYMNNWVLDSFTDTTYLFLAGFAVNAVASIGCKIAAAVLKNQLRHAVQYGSSSFYEIGSSFVTDSIDATEAAEITEELIKGCLSEEHVASVQFFNTNKVYGLKNSVRICNCIGNVTCILMLIFASFTLASAWHDLRDYYHTDKTPIPVYMVDEAEDENGKTTYTYYSAVTCNRIEGGFTDEKSKILEDYGDLNGDIGKEWLALYYTKDATAGNPIKAEFLCQKGSNTAENKVPLTMFGEKNAINLVDEKYAFNDEFGGIYLFYAVGNPLTGSVLTSGNIAIIAVGTACVAALGVFLIVRKKKKAAVSPEL